MVLYNSTPGFWDLCCREVVDPKRKKSVLPLLRQLSKERAETVFDQAVFITDNPSEIVRFLTAGPASALSAERSRAQAWRSRMTQTE
jgi:hypothetical protein